MRSGWIEHKGKKIWLARYNDFGEDEQSLFTEILIVTQKFLNESENSGLMLIDFTGTEATSLAIESIKDSGLRLKGVLKKTAVIGIDGIKNIFFKAIKRFIKIDAESFKDIESAKEWLVIE